MYLTKSSKPKTVEMRFRPLLNDEKISDHDFVEDTASGRRVRVKGSFYGFLRGQRPSQARMLPDVFDVVRES